MIGTFQKICVIASQNTVTVPKTGGLMYYLKVLDARSPKPRMLGGWLLLRLVRKYLLHAYL